MTERNENTTDDVFTWIDRAAKAVAVAAAFSVLLGITYNVTFFAVTKPEWLFYLSAADNLAGTFFALPMGMVAVVIQLAIMAICGWLFSDRSNKFERIRSNWLRLLINLLFVAAFLALGIAGLRWFTLGMTNILVAITVVVGAIAMDHYYDKEWPLKNRLAYVVPISAVSIFLCAIGLGVNAGLSRGAMIEIEIADRAFLVGETVRSLENGVILAQPRGWVWIPRAEIKRIREMGDGGK